MTLSGVFLFGDEITSTPNDRVKYGTYTRDSYTGLDYAVKRYYASTYGNFSSPDPSMDNVNYSNPLSWNAYAATTRKAAAAGSWQEATMTRITLLPHATALCMCCFVVAGAYSQVQTLNQLRKDAAIKGQSAETQSDGTTQLQLDFLGVDSTPAKCPNPVALDFFNHQIAYQRTEELNPFKGFQKLHADVWQRGPLTAFYIDDKLAEFAPSVRMTYLFGKGGLQGGGTCAAEKNWRECVEKSAGTEYATDVVSTCTITLDITAIPAWRPSPNDPTKRRIADELRNEIEAKWAGVQEIVIRDFNLEDNQITMYLKMPDGDYYQGCGFHATTEPHCEGWHLFGMVPNSKIRQRVFEKPYRLK